MQTGENKSNSISKENGLAPKGADVSIEINSDIQTIGEDAGSLNVVTMSVEVGSSSTYESISKKVKVKIGYPKDWKGQKFMIDEEIKEVSEETAKQFVAMGIAKIVKK